MTARPSTPGASDFPAPNLPASAQAWARAVAQRIAQLEARNARKATKAAALNELLVDSLHARQDAGPAFNYLGDIVGTG